VPSKDGNRQTEPRDAQAKPWKLRAAIASLSFITGASVAACGLALASRRKLRARFDLPTSNTPLQQIARYRTADGTHSIRANLLAEFEPGDGKATLHIAFCPPFERLPTVEAEPADDSEVTVKVTQVLHNGAHLEIRLPRPTDEKQMARIELIAFEPPQPAA
jgi:hypothetical protein